MSVNSYFMVAGEVPEFTALNDLIWLNSGLNSAPPHIAEPAIPGPVYRNGFSQSQTRASEHLPTLLPSV